MLHRADVVLVPLQHAEHADVKHEQLHRDLNAGHDDVPEPRTEEG